MREITLLGDERAVSDVLGFVLVFSLVLTTVALVYVTGFDSLQTARDAEERQNVERAFDILDDNLNEIVTGDSPIRGTEIKVGTSRMYNGDSISVTVNVTDDSGNTETTQIDTEPFIYETTSGQQVIYVNGAVLRSNVGGSSFVNEPDVRVTHDTIFMPLVETRIPVDEVSGVSGSTYVIRGESENSTLLAYNNLDSTNDDPPYTVEFRIDTPRTGVWERYCDFHPDISVVTVQDGDFVSCEFDSSVQSVIIQHEEISLRIN